MNRILFAAPLAIIASAVFVTASVSPAAAREDVCSTMPQSIKVAAATADASAAKKALKYSHTGELLCEAGNEHAAKEKFEVAFKVLGTSATELAQVSK